MLWNTHRHVARCVCLYFTPNYSVTAEAVIAAIKDTGDYDDVTCDRLRTILLAPHKHKDREAHKTKQTGTTSKSQTIVFISF